MDRAMTFGSFASGGNKESSVQTADYFAFSRQEQPPRANAVANGKFSQNTWGIVFGIR